MIFLRRYWYYLPLVTVLAAAALVYAAAGPDAHIAVQDNLDLFQAQYAMLRNAGLFDAQHAASPFLHGISRDVLPSEFLLPGLIYRVFPPLAAYLVQYFLKVVLGTFSFALLAAEIAGRVCKSAPSLLQGVSVAAGEAYAGDGVNPAEERRAEEIRALSVLTGLSYGLLNLFPAFSISFASLPLAVWMLFKLDECFGSPSKSGAGFNALPGSGRSLSAERLSFPRRSGKRGPAIYFAGLLLYPVLSYFSYFGLFLIGYCFLAFIILPFRRRRVQWHLAGAAVCLSAGSALYEYRLFRQMLFSDEVTIRSTMKMDSLGFGAAMREAVNILVNGMFHADARQKYLVLPLCAAAVLICLITGLMRVRRPGEAGKNGSAVSGVFPFFRRTAPVIAALILFNSFVYGIYDFEPFRSLVEKLVPPLKGWQFNRTVFFSPLLWYLLLFVILCDFTVTANRGFTASVLVTAVSALIILASPTNYNDLYFTARAEAYSLLKGVKVSDLSYGEFYSEELFDVIKEEIGCRSGSFAGAAPGSTLTAADNPAGADWAVSYGFHPAVLEYNGIATLDGYLGFYSQEYKEAFREVIAPALGRREATRAYYDDWGARCYLYSGEQDSVVQAVRNYPTTEEPLYVNADALRSLGCRYIFSRIRLTNAEELGLTLLGSYSGHGSAYTVHVYEFR